MTGTHLDVTIDRDVAILAFNRPAKLNALTVATRVQLAASIRDFGNGRTVRGIVVTGQGRAFSAGEDLTAAPISYEEMGEAFATFHDITRAIVQTTVPVVAAVNGLAVGGAAEITLCCDTRIGTPKTEFFQPENHRGLIISNASSLLLGRLIGHRAIPLILGAQRIDAHEALRIGLLDEIVPAETLLDHAIELITHWTADPRTAALHLQLLRPRLKDIEAAFAHEDQAARTAWDSGAVTDGVQRFWASKHPGVASGPDHHPSNRSRP